MKKRFLVPLILVCGITAIVAATLQWSSNPTAEGIFFYTVYDHTGSNYTPLATVTPTASPKQVWTISPTPPVGTAKNFTVTATNARGESPKSGDTTFPADVPSTPATPTLVP